VNLARPASAARPANAPNAAPNAAPAWLLWVSGVALLLGLAFTLRLFVLRDGFSEDEFFQLTFVNEGLPHFFVQFVRLDQHPFFHFLQLKLWALVSQSDGWMLFNSVAWHIASCAIIFAVGRAWQGTATGLLAAALYALVPQVLVASTMLRFYAMIPGLAVLAWWLNVKLLSGQDRRPWMWVALVATELALGYSHAIAFFFVAWLALAGAAQVAVTKPEAPAWRRWLWVQSVAGLLLVPLVLLAVSRILMGGDGEPGGNHDPGTLIDHWGGMVVGWGMQLPWARAIGAALFAAAIVAGLWQQRTRALTAVMLIGPYATALLVGLVLAPMFKTPVYSAVLVPFVCLVLAAVISQARWLWLAPALLVTGAVAAVPASDYLNSGVSPYRPVAEQLRKRAQAGDVVVVPKPYLYWATMRYAVGPQWGSAMEVLPALSDSWLRMSKRLGPDLTQMLKLTPRTQQVVSGGITYVVGQDATVPSATAQRVWLVQRPRYPLAPVLADGFVSQGVVFEMGSPENTQIVLYERKPR
jgi:hypothetical protein